MIKWLFINRSIRTKIVLSSVVISLIPMLILSFLFYRSSSLSLERTMVRSADQNAEYLSDDMDQFFRSLSSSALQVYGSNELVNFMVSGANYNNADIFQTKDALGSYYRLVQSKNKDVIKIMMFGKDNKLRDSWSRAASYDSIHLDDAVPHANQLLDLPFQHALMFTYMDKGQGERFFVYALTIYDPFYRHKYGTLVFYIRMRDFVKQIETYNRAPNNIVLQNDKGEIFYQTNDTFSEAVKPYIRSDDPATYGKHELQFMEDHQALVSTSVLDNANVGLTILYSSSELVQNRKYTLRLTVGAFALVMLVIALFSFMAQQFITRPVQQLSKAMRTVRKGDFHVTLKPSPWRDDLSELTRNFNYMTNKIQELIEQEYQLLIRNKEAQIIALQMQINPHFLYNTLQTIGGKAVLIGEYEIHEMCRALGDMFRYSFYEGNSESTIGLEMVHLKNYLYIQQLRFEESLVTEFQVEHSLLDCSVIRFVLQPIVENAIVHVLGKSQDSQLRLQITAAQQSDQIIITVRDNGPGIEAEQLARLRAVLEQKNTEVFSGISIGLKNVNERIRMYYGSAYGLRIESKQGEGTEVIVTIPYKNRGMQHV
ncbi:two-component system sensor histidine kinase YesM [Paenibacillus taihuensis]|uniref:histidine kinase n=1 Tax=Paenibacillus taihuensis TaxID=1156355 RepID=A0A3D9S9G2_9BACL|nr:sensor histidine kinase [Paenibacillus taihuensis]REE87446.1 two-component system sensor histidine kinase YesM [Paenibacillus taihuensis]